MTKILSDSKTLQFLANRHRKKAEDAAPTKISKFKRAKMEAAAGEIKKPEEKPTEKSVLTELTNF